MLWPLLSPSSSRICSLDEPVNLRERVDAMDRLEAYLVDEPTAEGAAGVAGAALSARARAISARLEAVNVELFRSIRADIRRGRGAASLGRMGGGGLRSSSRRRSGARRRL